MRRPRIGRPGGKLPRLLRGSPPAHLALGCQPRGVKALTSARLAGVGVAGTHHGWVCTCVPRQGPGQWCSQDAVAATAGPGGEKPAVPGTRRSCVIQLLFWDEWRRIVLGCLTSSREEVTWWSWCCFTCGLSGRWGPRPRREASRGLHVLC